MKTSKETYIYENGKRYREVPVPSAVPIWGAAGVWVLAGLLCPMYKWWVILLTAVASAVVGGELASFLPKKTKRVEVPYFTDNRDADEAARLLTAEAEKLRASATKIRVYNPEAARTVTEIAATTEKIREALLKDPDDLPKLRRFLNYYLPNTDKMTASYADLLAQGAHGQNIDRTVTAVETSLGQVNTAFSRQLDALFAEEALDITSDVQVLDIMFAQDNLKG